MKALALVIASSLFGAALLEAQSVVQHLQDVKTIFVAPMDGDNAVVANLIRDKLISHLGKYRGISVVETEDRADAILTGSWMIQTTPNAYGHSVYHMRGAMRLDSKDGVVLWSDEISNGPFARSASSSFADNVARKLAQAILADEPKKK
jgi:hypothetical protein